MTLGSGELKKNDDADFDTAWSYSAIHTTLEDTFYRQDIKRKYLISFSLQG